MIASEVELCNHALSLIGEARISDLTESNERARICNVLYPQTRDEILASHNWAFAVARVSLPEVDEENLSEYEYAYTLPVNLLRIIDVLDSESYLPINGADFRIEGSRLYYDSSPCVIRYVNRETVTARFPELFAQAVITSLAAKIAPTLSQNFGMAQSLVVAASNALMYAKAELTKTSLPKPKREMQLTDFN